MIVGVTGHQDLGSSATVRWVSDVVCRAVKEYNVTQGITCLATGTDQLYAEVLRKEKVPYVAVIPCDRYEETFSDKGAHKKYIALVCNAKEVVRLNFDRPSEKAFFEGGKEVVRRCEVLFAVWNGRAAGGLGGTADVVEYAIRNGKKVVHFNPIREEITIR